MMKCSKHLESPDMLLAVFEKEVDGYMAEVGWRYVYLLLVRWYTIFLLLNQYLL